MSSQRTKGSTVAIAEQLIAGANKHLPNATQVLLAGGTFTPAQITARLQAIVNLRREVDAAKAVTKAKLAVEKTDMPALRTFFRAFVTFVKVAYGTADTLADFGLHPPKPRTPPTVLAKAAAAAKRKATRAARHTMGIVQKKTVKGDVTGVVMVPITAPQPTPASPPSPSASAPNAGAIATPTPTPHAT